jgi:hypothetical protein
VVEAIAYSPDGKRICVNSYPDDSDGEMTEVWNLENGKREQVLDTTHSTLAPPVYMPDGERILIENYNGGFDVWDLGKGEVVAHFADDPALFGTCAASPDGKYIATCGTQSIMLWDAQTYEPTLVLWKSYLGRQIVGFTFGFVLWGITWGRITRSREEATEPVVEATLQSEPPEFERFPPPVLSVESPKPYKQGWVPLKVSAVLLVFWLILAFMSAGLIQDTWGWASSAKSFAVGLLVAPLLLILLGLSITVIHGRVFGYHGIDLNRARQIAKTDGRLYRVGNLEAWFAGPSVIANRLAHEVEHVSKRSSELYGQALDFKHKFLLLSFDQHEQFHWFIQRELPLTAVFLRWPKRQLVICERETVQRLTEPHLTLRMLLGYCFVSAWKKSWPDWWLVNVINQSLAFDDDTPTRIQHAHRRLRAILVRGELLDVRRWFELRSKGLMKLARGFDQPEGIARFLEFADFTTSLAYYMVGPRASKERAEQFTRFASDVRRRESCEETFRRHFGYGFDQLANEWQAWVVNEAVDDYLTPQPIIKNAIVDQIIPSLNCADTSFEQRQILIRRLGAAGYVFTLSQLLDQLQRGPSEIRDDVIWSLEAISGKHCGADVERWSLVCTELQSKQNEESFVRSASDEVVIAAVVEPTPPLRAEILDTRDVTAASSDRSHLNQPASGNAPLATTLRLCWGSAFLGGVAAILFSLAINLQTGAWWLFTTYFGVGVGVLAIVYAAGRRTKRFKLVAGLQIANIINCDPVNFILGIVELVLLSSRPNARLNKQSEESS